MRRNDLFTTALMLTMLSCCGALANAEDGKWVSLFDGKSIDGWPSLTG
jgi:hypothetical protein